MFENDVLNNILKHPLLRLELFFNEGFNPQNEFEVYFFANISDVIGEDDMVENLEEPSSYPQPDTESGHEDELPT